MDRIQTLKNFLEKTPDDPFLQHALGLEYVKLGDDMEAQQLFTSLLEKTPSYVGSYYHLGKVHERLGQLPEAIHVFEKGIKVAKEQKDAHAASELQAALSHANDILEDLEDN